MSLVETAREVAAEFEYPAFQVRGAVQEFLKEMSEGLQESGTTLQQIPTYVTAVPNGTEKGVYMAVDLGGTNFRVCSVQLHGNTTFSLTQSKVPIPRTLMVAKTSKELFTFLAKQIQAFLEKHHGEHYYSHMERRKSRAGELGNEEVFSLGFTFSFPVNQVGINRGKLIRWTKGFDIHDAIGQDVCIMLQDAIDELGLPVKVAALVNDTVGTLMARSYTSPGKTGTLLGAIFGTGTNGAYVEKLERITKLKTELKESDFDTTTGEMIVNTEWGSFDNNMRVLPDTPYDRILDAESPNPGIQMFEKRVSGMFLGEILRRAILALINHPQKVPLFSDATSAQNDLHSITNVAPDSKLYEQWGLDTSFLSTASADNSPGLRLIRQALDRDLGVTAASVEDAEVVKLLATAIGRRAARLSAVALGAVVIASGRLDPNKSTAAIPRSSTITEASAVAGEATRSVDSAAYTKATLTNDLGSHNSRSTSGDVNRPTEPSQAGGVEGDEEPIDLGVDGSLVEFYPNFEDYIREALREIPEIGEAGERRIRIGIAKDGSGVGAALIALVSERRTGGGEGPAPVAAGGKENER